MKVYVAGPDVFRPDALQWAEQVREACRQRGLTALVPLDGDETTAAGIYASNVAMIQAADVVVANLNPFRGAEPDSGTCFELGFAAALGKPVMAYFEQDGVLAERLQAFGLPLRRDGQGWCDADGLRVEDFGLPLNLMLAVPARWVVGGLEAALDAVCASIKGAGQ